MIMCAKQKRFFALCVALCATLCLSFSTAGRAAAYSQEYGVFLGIGAEEINRLEDCRLVVIEPSEFQADQVAKLHDAGKTVYGYINIGAIEEYRPYYGRFVRRQYKLTHRRQRKLTHPQRQDEGRGFVWFSFLPNC